MKLTTEMLRSLIKEEVYAKRNFQRDRRQLKNMLRTMRDVHQVDLEHVVEGILIELGEEHTSGDV